MTLKRTTKRGRPAYKAGDHGKAYSYQPGNRLSREVAKTQALAHGRASGKDGGRR